MIERAAVDGQLAHAGNQFDGRQLILAIDYDGVEMLRRQPGCGRLPNLRNAPPRCSAPRRIWLSTWTAFESAHTTSDVSAIRREC